MEIQAGAEREEDETIIFYCKCLYLVYSLQSFD